MERKSISREVVPFQWVALLILVEGCRMSNLQSAAESGLPCEPGSASELLSSTHVFQVEVRSVKELPWEPGPVGQKRRLNLGVRLVEIFKGKLSLEKGKSFEVSVEQHRIGASIIEDVPGAWSHVKPAAGASYLVLARGTATDPAELMQDGPFRGLFDAAQAGDARLALRAESQAGSGAASLGAARTQLRFAKAEQASAGDLYARYLWVRVLPAFSKKPAALLPDVLALLTAKDAPVLFRQALISMLSNAIDDFELAPELRVNVAQTYLALLLKAESSPLHDHLACVEIPGLLFLEDRPILAVREVVPNVTERGRLKAALRALDDTEEIRQLVDWLDGK
jgi:hypothetical protein